MSLDNQYEPVATSVNTMPPNNSGGGRKWIWGGCGCLGLLTLMCIGGLIFYSFTTFTAVRQEARSFIEGSTVVQQELGSPITIDGETMSQDGTRTLVFEFNVTGPKGSGVATVNMENDGQSLEFKLGESSLEVDGEKIDLNAENEFGIEMEGLDLDF